jgi:hypothetical protein
MLSFWCLNGLVSADYGSDMLQDQLNGISSQLGLIGFGLPQKHCWRQDLGCEQRRLPADARERQPRLPEQCQVSHSLAQDTIT